MPYPDLLQSHSQVQSLREALMAGVNAFCDTLLRDQMLPEAADAPENGAPDLPPFNQVRDREMGHLLGIVWDGCTENGAKMPHRFYANKMLAAGYDEYEGFAGEKRSARLLFKARHDDALQKLVHPMHL